MCLGTSVDEGTGICVALCETLMRHKVSLNCVLTMVLLIKFLVSLAIFTATVSVLLHWNF
jgi:hypothetical protein